MNPFLAVFAACAAVAGAFEPPSIGGDALAPHGAVPLGDPRVSERLAAYRDFDSRLRVEGEAVYGVFKACDVAVIGETPECAEVWFSFPELRVDRELGRLLLHGEPIGKLGNGVFTGPRTQKPWQLVHRVELKAADARSGGRPYGLVTLELRRFPGPAGT